MKEFRRYAVFYVPETGVLCEFLTAWLGWDIRVGCAVAHPMIEGIDIANVTQTPRKYGLHGTIKPPFRLADGRSIAGLHAALEALCGRIEPIDLDGLQLSCLDGFLALLPKGETNALSLLAAAVLLGLDDFRGRQTQAQINKRRAAGLSLRQDELLARWGYPYVMDEFRFHITLTDRLGDAEGHALRKRLKKIVKPMLPALFRVESLCLVGEDAAGMFHLIRRYPLSG